MMSKRRFLWDVLVILAASFLSALGLYVFVFQADFAPGGVEGIATMLQETTGINAGYYSLLINLPLLTYAWFRLNKKYVIYTLLSTAFSSMFLVILEKVQFYQYVATSDFWIPAVFSGVLMGVRTAWMIQLGGSTGGVDIIGCVIQKQRPYLQVERPISLVCYIIIGVSFFVYRDIQCILLAVLQTFVFAYTMGRMLHSTRNAIEAKIITQTPERFKEEIVRKLQRGATVVPCTGMFTGEGKSMVITIINIRQRRDLLEMTKKYPDSFVYFNDVSGVWGNFWWKRREEIN